MEIYCRHMMVAMSASLSERRKEKRRERKGGRGEIGEENGRFTAVFRLVLAQSGMMHDA